MFYILCTVLSVEPGGSTDSCASNMTYYPDGDNSRYHKPLEGTHVGGEKGRYDFGQQKMTPKTSSRNENWICQPFTIFHICFHICFLVSGNILAFSLFFCNNTPKNGDKTIFGIDCMDVSDQTACWWSDSRTHFKLSCHSELLPHCTRVFRGMWTLGGFKHTQRKWKKEMWEMRKVHRFGNFSSSSTYLVIGMGEVMILALQSDVSRIVLKT